MGRQGRKTGNQVVSLLQESRARKPSQIGVRAGSHEGLQKFSTTI